MMRVLVIIGLALLAALGVQSFRLNTAHHKIDTQQNTIADQSKKLTQKNGQLIALNIQMQTNRRAQTQLYATAEQNGVLLRDRQRKFEELKRESKALCRWANTHLADAVIRLHQRPALAGGEPYRQLSQRHPPPAGLGSSAQ